MANICNNELRIYWDSPIDTDEVDEKHFLDIEKVFDKHLNYYEVLDSDGGYMNISFDSKWDFPEQLMEDIVPTKLQECMEYSSSIFCDKLPIPAVPETGDHWIH